MAPILPRVRISSQVRPENFMVCPAEAFSLTSPAFLGDRLLWIRILRNTTFDFSMFENRNCSLSTLFLRPLAGLLTISMTKQTITAINASAFRLVITTQGRVPKITWRSVTFSSMHSEFWLQDAGLASRLVELATSIRAPTLGTAEDVCSLPLLTRSLANFRPDPLALSTFTSRFLKAGLCRKMQDSPSEQHPVAFLLIAFSGLPFGTRILSLSFDHGSTLFNFVLNPEILAPLSFAQYVILHKFSVCGRIFVLFEFFDFFCALIV